MSNAARHDLSGRWRGFFNYPNLLPATEFEAELRDVSGLVTGLTTEPHHDGSGAVLHAVLEGSREGSLVRFRKTYDDLDDYRDTVRYEGRIDSGGDEISGEWNIPGVWSGSFLMIRASKAGERASRKIEEKV